MAKEFGIWNITWKLKEKTTNDKGEEEWKVTETAILPGRTANQDKMERARELKWDIERTATKTSQEELDRLLKEWIYEVDDSVKEGKKKLDGGWNGGDTTEGLQKALNLSEKWSPTVD